MSGRADPPAITEQSAPPGPETEGDRPLAWPGRPLRDLDGAPGPGVIDIGTVTDWEHALNDRVPAVLRTPGSALSRSYRTAAGGLLLRINDLGRKSDGTPAIGISTATGSGMRHR